MKKLIAICFILFWSATTGLAADTKGSDLSATGGVDAANDKLYVIDATGPSSKSDTVQTVVNAGLAAPGAIGGTTPAAGTFTTLTAGSASSITAGTGSSAAGSVILKNATNNNAFTITSGVSGAAIGWTLPTTAPGGANYLLNVDADGTMGYTDPSTLGGGSGDVTGVGNCDSGACLDGSSDGGTNIAFYDGTANKITISAQASALGADKLIYLPITATDGQYLKVGVSGNTWTLSTDAPAGSGDVTGVGDCASGACLDGSSDGGTYIRLYDGNSHYTQLAPGNSTANLTFTFPTAYPAASGYLMVMSDAGVISTSNSISGTFDIGDSIASGHAVTMDANGALQTAFTNLLPDAADGAALGSATYEWSDLFLADGAVINLGADQDVTLTHVADTGILLNAAMQLQFRDSAIYINSGTDGYLDLEADTGIRFNGPVTLANEGSITAGALILGDSTPDAEGEIGYASNQVSVHDGTASRALLQVASTLITKSEYLPIRYAEADDSVTAPADAAEISTTTAIGRAFDAATEEGVVFWWDVPLDYSAGIKFQVVYALMADASADNTVVFGLSGCSVGNSEAIACSEGTAVTKADELGTNDDQYQIMISDWSDAVTVTGIAAGEIAKLLFYRDADAAADDYGSDVAVIGIRIKYQAKVNASSDY